MQHSFELIRNAPVVVNALNGKKNHPIAELIIDDRYRHRFDEQSRVSKHLDIMTPQDLQDRLTGGHYFFVEDELVDFRDGFYNGFVHTDDTLSKLNEIIGIRQRENPTGRRGRQNSHNDTLIPGSYSLSALWSSHPIVVPEYQTGGEFKSALSFSWNPFTRCVNSSFMLWRLICANGMRGLSQFLNSKIPLVNRWEEHLEIANKQIQNKVSSKIIHRLSEMGRERASVAEAGLIAQHAALRMKDRENDSTSRTKLSRIATIASPRLHLAKTYKFNVFNDKRVAAQVPSHLTTFDLYNMATEIRTHTKENKQSTDHALDLFANDLVFNDKRADVVQTSTRFALPNQSTFSDPETAFFGLVH
jgi:hypothetical protein